MKNKNLNAALKKFNALSTEDLLKADLELINPELADAIKGGDTNCPKNATCSTFCGVKASCGQFSVG